MCYNKGVTPNRREEGEEKNNKERLNKRLTSRPTYDTMVVKDERSERGISEEEEREEIQDKHLTY